MSEKESIHVTWAKQFESVRTLFKRLASKKSGSKKTEKAYAGSLHLFHEFCEMTPDDIVKRWNEEARENYEQALNSWDMKLDDFISWLTREKGIKKSTAVSHWAGVKSLIKYNSRFKLTIATPKKGVTQSYAPLSLGEIKDLSDLASPQQRWVIMGLKDSGMSREDFARLTYGDVKQDLTSGKRSILMKVVREKEQVKYATFLGSNAIDALKTYLKTREARGEKFTDDTPLTLTEKTPYEPITPKEVTQIIERLGKKLGFVASPHRIRKTFETTLSLKVKHPIVLKYWMGLKLSMSDIEAAYVIPHPEDQRKLYEESYEQLDLTRMASIEERERVIRALTEKIMRKEPLTPEDMESIQRYGIRLGKRRERIMTNGGTPCSNGEHCPQVFEQIKENDLLTYLRGGWSIVHRLQSGEVIVRRSLKGV